MVETRLRRPLRGRLTFWHYESGRREAGEPSAHRTVATSTPSRISEQGAPTDDSNQSIRGETEMERVLERCCALDVHKRQVTACVHVPDQQGRRSELRAEFQTMTSELLALRDWLQGLGVTHVAMEATGVYWKPVYYLLEDDFELWLVNAQHVKNVPGRKTDVQDAQWLCQLLEHGLLGPSFVPPKPMRELRDLTRYRKSLVWERPREANRLQKLLEDANIKLGDVASDVLGASGKAMLRALCAGDSDPQALAELAKGKLRAKLPALGAALAGRFRAHHALLVSHLLSHIEYLDRTADRCSACALSSQSVSCSARSPAWPNAPPR